MTKRKKLIKKFLDNPQSINYRQLEKILIHFGFEKIKGKGSHVKFRRPSDIEHIIIPVHNNKCKIRYNKETSKIIKLLINNHL